MKGIKATSTTLSPTTLLIVEKESTLAVAEVTLLVVVSKEVVRVKVAVALQFPAEPVPVLVVELELVLVLEEDPITVDLEAPTSVPAQFH